MIPRWASLAALLVGTCLFVAAYVDDSRSWPLPGLCRAVGRGIRSRPRRSGVALCARPRGLRARRARFPAAALRPAADCRGGRPCGASDWLQRRGSARRHPGPRVALAGRCAPPALGGMGAPAAPPRRARPGGPRVFRAHASVGLVGADHAHRLPRRRSRAGSARRSRRRRGASACRSSQGIPHPSRRRPAGTASLASARLDGFGPRRCSRCEPLAVRRAGVRELPRKSRLDVGRRTHGLRESIRHRRRAARRSAARLGVLVDDRSALRVLAPGDGAGLTGRAGRSLRAAPPQQKGRQGRSAGGAS